MKGKIPLSAMIKWLKIVWRKYKEEHIFNYKILNFDRYYNIFQHKFLRSHNFTCSYYIYIIFMWVLDSNDWNFKIRKTYTKTY